MNLVDKYSTVPSFLLVTPVCLNPRSRPLLQNLKSAGSRYVLWAMCHLVPPAHPNRWWNRGAEAIAIKARDVAGLAPGLAALGKAKPVAWFLVKGRQCGPADSWSTRAMLAYGRQKRDWKENTGFFALGGRYLCPQMAPSTLETCLFKHWLKWELLLPELALAWTLAIKITWLF